MRLTKSIASNLARFGCSHFPKQNAICIDWGLKPLPVAQSANILVRLIHTDWNSGPLICLALEISINRALAQYYFFPFDLRSTEHTKYLSRLTETGKLKILFFSTSGQIDRAYEVPMRQRGAMRELLAQVISNANSLYDAYKFEESVDEFEQHTRIVDFFQYVVTDAELRKVIKVTAEKGACATAEERVKAEEIAKEFFDVCSGKYELLDREFLARIPRFRRTFLFMLDLKSHFHGDAGGLQRFLVNVIAAHTPKEDHRQLELGLLIIKSLSRLIDDFRTDGAGVSLETDLRDFLNHVVEGKGLPLKALVGLASAIGIQLGGEAGRPPRDYSREYDWKSSGLSWTDVTRKSLAETPEMLAEFGGRDFDALDFRQRESLKHRIEVGVKSYAKRVGKPFPIDRPSTMNKPQEID